MAKQLKAQESKAQEQKEDLLMDLPKIKEMKPTTPFNHDNPKPLSNDKMLETKMDAIIEKLPLIEKCNEICNFILEHYNLQKTFKDQASKKEDERNKAELYRVFEHYGISQGTENDLPKLYTYIFHSDEDVGVICKYLALKWVSYERDNFIIKEQPQDEWRKRNPGSNKWANIPSVIPQYSPK